MQFIVDHVRMTDVMEYIRDVLRGYGALMAEPPTRTPGAVWVVNTFWLPLLVTQFPAWSITPCSCRERLSQRLYGLGSHHDRIRCC